MALSMSNRRSRAHSATSSAVGAAAVGRVALKAALILVDGYPVSGCQVCGRNPSGRVILGRNTGFLVMRQWHEFKGRLCRPHAIQASATYLWKTLLFGWWGVISFLVNWGAVAIDLASLVRSLFIRRPEGEANLMNFSFGRWEANRRIGAQIGLAFALQERRQDEQ